MRFTLIDLKIKGKKANREHTGGFGSYMESTGFFGKLISKAKAKLINLPILTFAFTAEIIKRNGHQCFLETSTEIKEADIIIIASSMHCWEEENQAAKLLKRNYPKSKVGLYGPFAHTNHILFDSDIDFIIGGELESAILEFLENKIDLNGLINTGVVKNLDDLGFPDWSLFPYETFSYFPMLRNRVMLPIQSSRGCSFNCDFCPYMVSQTPSYRKRKPKLVVDEIEHNIKKFNMKSFLFRDICFTLDKKHAAAIAQELIERKISIDWGCETRLDCLTFDLIDLLYDSGMRGVNLGIESGDTEILKNSGKRNPSIQKQEEIINYMNSKKIRVNGFYMLGLVDDTVESMNKTIAYANKLNTQGAQFCVTTPFPGTPLFEKQVPNIISYDYTKYTEYNPVLEIKGATTKEIQDSHSRAFKEFYMRFEWQKKYLFPSLKGFIKNRLATFKLLKNKV